MRKTTSMETRNDFAFNLRRKFQGRISKLANKLDLRKFNSQDFKIEHVDVKLT